MESLPKQYLAKQLKIDSKYLDDMERLFNANKDHNRSISGMKNVKDFQNILKANNLL
jgi:hypothetical protein